MRIIVSFNGGGLTINFENISKISDYGDHVTFYGDLITITVNAMDICTVASASINKRWLLTADEVYFDTRIEEA